MMTSSAPIILNYSQPPPTKSRHGLIAILAVTSVFSARVGWQWAHRPLSAATAAAVSPSPPRAGINMQMGNSLNHNSEGQNVLYADGHVEWDTQPVSGENRGQNIDTWLDNIYTVQTSNLSSTGGVASGVPYDDKDAIMLPTSN
jgi:prepilin-type processing-associated H-X9-DG protein